MTYELELEHYRGPLDKLLELIEARELAITDISLAQVTEDFLRYVRELEAVETPLLADFIAVASRLILIKSKSLLPEFRLTNEEEQEIKDLERRLSLYRELRPAMKTLGKLWSSKEEEFSRPYFLDTSLAQAGGTSPIFYPGNDLSAAALKSALEKIAESLGKYQLETQVLKEKIVSLEEKMKEIVERLKNESEMSFEKISRRRSSAEVITLFLAILHLAHDRSIALEQAGHFSDIMIKKTKRA